MSKAITCLKDFPTVHLAISSRQKLQRIFLYSLLVLHTTVQAQNFSKQYAYYVLEWTVVHYFHICTMTYLCKTLSMSISCQIHSKAVNRTHAPTVHYICANSRQRSRLKFQLGYLDLNVELLSNLSIAKLSKIHLNTLGQKYSRLRYLIHVKGLAICFYLGWSGSILQFRKI